MSADVSTPILHQFNYQALKSTHRPYPFERKVHITISSLPSVFIVSPPKWPNMCRVGRYTDARALAGYTRWRYCRNTWWNRVTKDIIKN